LVEIRINTAAPEEVPTPLLAVGVRAGASPPGRLAEVAAPAISGGDFSGREGETALLYAGGAIAAQRLLLVGLGEDGPPSPEALRKAAAAAARRARSSGAREAALVVEGGGEEVRAAAEGALLGLYRFSRYKSNREAGDALEKLELLVDGAREEEARGGARVGRAAAAAAALARDLANEPSNTATPEYLAERAREIARRHGMGCTVLDREGIGEEGLAGLAAVGRAAQNEPRFIALEHRRGGEAPPVVLVGKAVTFDSGGISLKPSSGMEDMKFDMSGGAAVLGAMEAVGALELPLNVVALVPATENLPGGRAFKPGDVLRFRSGKTTEIVSTDAEGRLILADALSYARRYNPAAVVDCATLTGACVVALGHHASGLMGNDERLISEVRAAGEAVGERAWPMPLFEEYTEQIKGDVADIKNSGGRPAGALTAGAFLKEFVDYPWAHLDIAGTAYTKKDGGYRTKGATGVPARLLVEFLIRRAEEAA